MDPDSFPNWWKREEEKDIERKKRQKEEETLEKYIELAKKAKKK